MVTMDALVFAQWFFVGLMGVGVLAVVYILLRVIFDDWF